MTEEEVQEQAAQTVNESADAGTPVPTATTTLPDVDLERGEGQTQ